MHNWKDLIFDINGSDERVEYMKRTGLTLPLMHTTEPIAHAEKCREYLVGEFCADGHDWSLCALVPIEHTQLTDSGHPDIDISTLEDSYAVMLRVDAHARKSQPEGERPSKPPPSKPKTAAKRRR